MDIDRASSLRALSPSDISDVKTLCEECFPIRYSDSWYTYITSNKVYSLGSYTIDGELKGMLVAELQPLSQLETEIGPVLESAPRDSLAMYIISLGVRSQYRQKGLGSHLVKTLLTHVSHMAKCKVVYLHVLATNNLAVGCSLVLLVAAQDDRDPCPISGGRVTIGDVICPSECVRAGDDRMCQCDDECLRNRNNDECPDIQRHCSLSCPSGFIRDDNGCERCLCARPDTDDDTDGSTNQCRFNATQFAMRSRCRLFCVRRNADGCFMCDRSCNDSSSGEEMRPECGTNTDNTCPEERSQCLASGPSAIPRCEQRVMEGMQCGRINDPREFSDFDDDSNDGDDDEREREESRRRDNTDEDTRTDSVLGSRGRVATRDLERTARLDVQCQASLRCNINRMCEQRPNVQSNCTMRQSMNPRDEIQCDDSGMFRPLQCRRNDDGNRFRCVCVNRRDGSMIPDTVRMSIRDRDDTRIPDCTPRSYRNCTVQRNGQRFRVRHGERAVNVTATRCMSCECRDGNLERCEAVSSDVDCRKIDNGDNQQNCQRNGMTIAHGEQRMIDDCNMCGCNNGRMACTAVRQCRREGDELTGREQACENCRNAMQRIVSGNDGRNFPSRCAAMNCSQLQDNQLLDGPRSNQPLCSLNPCRAGVSCIRLGGRSCNRMEGCEADDVRMCVNRNNVTERVPTTNRSRPSNPADRDGVDDNDNNAVCGSDRRTYRSLANMVQSGPADVQVAFSGPCQRQECNRGQVCGTDRVVYNSSCDLDSQSANARVDYMGECMGMGMNRTSDEICSRVRENKRCNHTEENCKHLVRPTEGCCPVCGGIVTLAIDEEALSEHSKATGEDIDVDALVRRGVQAGVIPVNATGRCRIAATKPTNAMGNMEITFDAQDREKDGEYCNMMSKQVAKNFMPRPRNETQQPQQQEEQLPPIQNSYVLAATDVPLVTEGAPGFAASLTLVITAMLIALVY